MKLQDFLNTNLRYDYKDIATDPELSRQIQVRLINLKLLDPPADGLFGPISSAALERFQTLMRSSEVRYLSAETAELLIETKPEDVPGNSPTLRILRNTVIKARPLESAALPETEKQTIAAGQEFSLISYEDAIRKHIRVTLRQQTFPKLHSDGQV